MTPKQEIQILTFFIGEKSTKEIILRRDKIAATTGIHISVMSADAQAKTIKFRVEQVRLINNWILSQHQLVTRVKDLFDEVLPANVRKHYAALTYNPNLDEIDVEWIKSRMGKFGITNADIIKHLNIDKSTLSLFFSGERGLTKSQKTAFLYYFMVFEINQDIRQL